MKKIYPGSRNIKTNEKHEFPSPVKLCDFYDMCICQYQKYIDSDTPPPKEIQRNIIREVISN